MKINLFWLIFMISQVYSLEYCNKSKCDNFCIDYINGHDIKLFKNKNCHVVQTSEVFGVCRYTEDRLNCACFINDDLLPNYIRSGYNYNFY